MSTTIKLLLMQPILCLWVIVCFFAISLWQVVSELYKKLSGWGNRRKLIPFVDRTTTATKISYTSNDAQATAASFLFIAVDKINSLSTTNTNCRMRSSLLKPKFIVSVITIACLFFVSVVFGQTTGDFRSVSGTNKNWSNAASWQRYNGSIWENSGVGGNNPGKVPGITAGTTSSNVTVIDGSTVNLDASPTIATLTIGQGASGILFLLKNTTQTLSISGNLSIAAGGQIKSENSGSANSYVINVGGNFSNNGTAILNVGNPSCNINLNGTVTQDILGSSTTTFNNLTISNSSVPVTASSNFNLTGTLSVSANAVFNPDASVIINSGAAAGTISGSGTIKVTRTIATADYFNQYKFSTNTLSGLTVDYAGAGAQTVNALNYGNLSISENGTRTVTLANTGSIGITGSFSPTSTNTTYAITGSTINFNGTGAQSIPAFTYNNLQASSGGIKTLGGAIVVNGNIAIANSTLDVSSNNYAISVAGNWTNSNLFNARSGTVTFNGSSGTQTLNPGVSSFNNIVHTGASLLQLSGANLIVGGAFTNSGSGNFDANGLANTVTGLTTVSGGSYLAKAAQQAFNGGLTISGGIFSGSTGTVIASDVNINGGTLSAPTGAFNVLGNWTLSSGLFNHNNATVIFKGSSGIQTLSGNTTFYNLTVDNSGATFSLGSATTTIANAFSKISGNAMSPGGSTLIFTGASGSITGANAKGFNNVQINPGANISNTTGGNLSISGDFTNNGTFTQASTLSTAFDNNTNLAGTGNTSFGGVSIQGGAVVNAGSHNISVAAAWSLTSGGTFNGGTGTVSFAGSTAQTLGGSGNTTFNNLTINKSSNSLTLTGTGGNVTVNGVLALTNGIIDGTTNNKTVTVGSTGSISGGSSTSYVNGKLIQTYNSAGSKTFPIGKGGNYRPLTFAYTFLDAGSSVSAEQIESNFPGTVPANTSLFAGRYWSVSQTGGSAFSYDITLDGTGFSTTNTAVPVILKDNGTTTVYAATPSGNNYTASGITSFGNFALAAQCDPPTISTQPVNSAAVCDASGTRTFSVSATGTGSGSFTYRWQVNAGSGFNNITNGGVYSGATTSTLTLTNPTAGMNGYTYRVIISRPCGSNTTSDPATLTVNAYPSAPFVTPSSFTYCQFATASPLTATGSNLLWYTSASGGTGSSTAPTPSTAILGTTSYYVSQTVNGCESPRTRIDVIVNANTAINSESLSGSTYCQDAIANSLSVGATGPNLTYQWYSNISASNSGGVLIDGATNSSFTPSTATPGATYYYVVVSGDCGTATSNVSGAIVVNATPATPSIVPESSTTVCQGGGVVLTSSANAGNQWYKDGQPIEGATNLNYTATTSGSYTVVVTENDCSSSSSTAVVVTVNPLPTATINYSGSPYCATGTAGVTQTGQGGGTYSSTTGLIINSVTGEINLANSTPGTYTVTYSFTDGTCPNTTNAIVLINEQPTLSVHDLTIPCGGTATDLTSAVDSHTGTLYYYQQGGGLVEVSDPSSVGEGTYLIKVKIGDCEDSREVTVTKLNPPTASIAEPATTVLTCTTPSITLTASGGTSYAWSNGTSEVGTSASLAVSTPGTYTVTVTAANGCSDQAQITITRAPSISLASASAGTIACHDGTTTLTVAASGGTGTLMYSLDSIGTPQVSNTFTVSAGIHFVTVTDANGCSVNTNNVNIANPAAVTPPSVGTQTFCGTGNPTVASLPNDGGNYQWYANSNSSAPLAGNTPLSTGTYYVTTTNGTCESPKAAVSIVVNNTPAPVVSTQNFCSGQNPTVVNLPNGGGSYNWYSSANGGTALGGTTALSTNIYYITQTLNGCESGRAAVSVIVNPTPTATISYTGSPYCATGTASVSQAGQGGGTYSAGAGLVINTNTGAINLAASTPGTYTVIYSFSNNGCSNSTTASVTINALPAITGITGSNTVCIGSTVTLSNATPGGAWSSSNNTIATVSSTGVVTGMAAGQVTITYTVTSNGCSNSSSLLVTVNNCNPCGTPVIIANGPTTFCQGGNVVLTSSLSGTGYQWFRNGVAISGSNNKSYTVTQSGSYHVVVKVTQSCSATSAQTMVTVNPLPAIPTITANGPTTFCQGGSVTFVSSVANGYQWYVNGSPLLGATSQSYVATLSGSYTVRVTNASGCAASSVIKTVTVAAAPATPTASDVSRCGNGSVTLAASGTGTLKWYSNSNLTTQVASGSTFTTPVLTSSTTYYVTATNATGCASTAKSVAAIINPRPDVYNVTGGGAFCGTAGASVGLSGSQAGINYQLYRNNSATTNIVAGTGNAISFGNQTISGTYAVVASNPSTTCTNVMNGSAVVIAGSIPSITIPDAFAYSKGVVANTIYTGWNPAASITLTATVSGGNSPYTYQWRRNNTNAIIGTGSMLTINQAGTYTVTVTTSTGCVATASKVINAVNVSCGNGLVRLCGTDKKGVKSESCVLSSSVDNYLNTKSPTYMLGSCSSNATNARIDAMTTTLMVQDEFNITAYPNPSQNQFNIKLESSNSNDAIMVIVYNVNGNVVETRSNLKAGQVIQVGGLYRPGMYMIEMIQGTQHKQIKLVKIPD